MIEHRPIQVLLVEDNPADVRLTREAFREGKIQNELSVVSDGIEALEFLEQTGAFEDARRPDLILLDLNLPRLSGREVLERVKSHPDFRRIPVVILTTSDAERDILASYDLHANSYIVKPIGYESFLSVTREIEQFWLAVVKLPPDRSDRPKTEAEASKRRSSRASLMGATGSKGSIAASGSSSPSR